MRPTVFWHGPIAPLEDKPRPPAAVLDQLDGTRVLHVLCALSVDLQDLVPYLENTICVGARVCVCVRCVCVCAC